MIIIGNFPIIHRGYLDIIEKYHLADIYILTTDFAKTLYPFELDLRKIPEHKIKNMLSVYDRNINFLNEKNIENIDFNEQVVVIKDDCTKNLIDKHLNNLDIIEENGFFYHSSKDVHKTNEQKFTTYSPSSQDIDFMKKTLKMAKNSGCFWRQLGSIIVKDNQIVSHGYNKMLPNDDECYKIGCIRDNLQPGTKTEYCSAIHAEANCISQAAKKGIALDGASIYVTIFPCPMCAKLIAVSGIRKCFYNQGWSSFDGERVMKANGVEILKIDIN